MDGWNCKRRIDLKKITISAEQKKILLEHAEKEIPNESCAILFGEITQENSIVREIFLTKNIEESPVNFTISNEQLIQGYDLAEKKHMDVVAIFHSHPNSRAYPSETDKKFMQSNPVVWIIYSAESKDFKAFFLDKDIIEIEIQG